MYSLGIDFGTTNTVLRLADAEGPRALSGSPRRKASCSPSALHRLPRPAGRPRTAQIAAGPWAIEAYVEDPAETRFIQSFKSFAAAESFTETQILGRRYRFEDLLSTFLLKVRDYAGASWARSRSG
jgi:hypothetical chaperone protein